MATLTIQKGQTLSGIAKSNGTTVDALLKANPSIKDPNKIYAGASLSLPETPKTPLVSPGASVSPPVPPKPQTTPVTTRVDQLGGSGASPVPQKSTLYGAEVPTSTSMLSQYRSELGLDKALKGMQDSQTAYLDTLKNLPKKSDIYTAERTKRGVDEMQKNLQSLDDRLATMELSIEDSEKDIRNRMTQGGGLVTESQTQRIVTSEKQPLIDEYRKLLNERNRLATNLGVADTAAKEAAGMQYEDSTLPLTVAEKTLGFQKDQYGVLGDILSQVFGASQKDVANLIEASKYGKEEEKKDAQEVIDRAIKLANLANDTPAGTVLDIGGNKVVGTKKSSGSDGDSGSSSDIEAYALELLNNPNFTASNVPQGIRAQVLKKRDQIIAEANAQQQADAAMAESMKSSQPKITAQDFGAGVKDTFTKTIPNIAKSGFNTSKNFLKGLFGIGN